NVSRRFNTGGVFVESSPGNGNYNVFDMVRWNWHDDLWVDAWVFTVNGSQRYALQVVCANPIGNLSGLPDFEPDPEEYNLQPTANSNGLDTVEPGGEIDVDGVVENIG